MKMVYSSSRKDGSVMVLVWLGLVIGCLLDSIFLVEFL